MSSGRRQYMP